MTLMPCQSCQRPRSRVMPSLVRRKYWVGTLPSVPITCGCMSRICSSSTPSLSATSAGVGVRLPCGRRLTTFVMYTSSRDRHTATRILSTICPAVSTAVRPAGLDDVRDVDLVAGQADGLEDLVEELSGAPDERPPREVLVLAGRLADEHEPGVLGSLAEHEVVREVAERGRLARRPALELGERHAYVDNTRAVALSRPGGGAPCAGCAPRAAASARGRSSGRSSRARSRGP